MHEGRVTAAFNTKEADQAKILKAAMQDTRGSGAA
jgi:hypothetical protein